MALIKSLNTAVTGLQAQQFRIEVIGNNIANVDTTGFKSSRVDFGSVLSQTLSFGIAPEGFLGGVDPIQVGLGTRVAATPTDFGQGPTEATGVVSDLAVQGEGFFVLTDESGDDIYTRDGSFSLDSAGLLHDPATGFLLQGFAADENFQVNPGSQLSNLTVPLGELTIARATENAFFTGNLDASGPVASQGTLQFSERLYDNRFANGDLISSENPLGLDRATADTPLANLVRPLGGFVPFTDTTTGTAGASALVFPDLATQPTGVVLGVSATKGDRALAAETFTVGDPPPTGGTTLGDFIGFLRRSFGINTGIIDGAEQAENTISHTRVDSATGEEVNGTLTAGTGGAPDDTATLTGLTDFDADFGDVRVGDFIRFTSGQAAGEIAEIIGVSASTPGGTLDTLSFRSDGFNSLGAVPILGDTYVIHAPASAGVAADDTLVTVDGASGTVTVGAPTTSGDVTSFSVTDTSVGDFALEQGVAVAQRVDYVSAGSVVSGWVSSVAGDTFTVAFDATLAQSPDGGSTFTVLDLADGTIELAGNTGDANDISDIEVTSEGNVVSLFAAAPVVAAEGESVTLTATVFDSLGTPRPVRLTFVFEGSSASGPNTWRYFAEAMDDADGDPVVASGTVLFGAQGQFLGTGSAAETIAIDLAPTAGSGAGAVTPLTFELDLSRLTQLATDDSQIQLDDQDGFASGTLAEYAIGRDGLIQGIFTNGLVRTLGQVALARFANPSGLTPEADNFFRAAPNSGIPNVGAPGTFGRGAVLSGFLEESNVDLAEQFTDLIIGQRAFEANARTVSVSDEMLQELVNLV